MKTLSFFVKVSDLSFEGEGIVCVTASVVVT